MITEFSFQEIVEPAITWFDKHKRAMPWREDREAYHIWVSEIMLQQTRVQAVIEYYLRFMKALPSVEDLARCPEDELMKLWEGLGYYNRARNLKEAANTIVTTYGGKMPETTEELLSLKGIGDYTARAIASQAFGVPVVAVDGNVLRLVTRLSRDNTDIGKASFKRQVEGCLDLVSPPDRAGDFCQALMELGACICLPNAQPDCENCPLKAFCESYRHQDMQSYPVKQKAKERRIENRTILILRYQDHVVLSKRGKTGLLAGLYEFPGKKGFLSEKEVVQSVKAMGFSPLKVRKMEPAKHIFSHVEWHMEGYEVRLDETLVLPEETILASVSEMEERYCLPAAFEGFKKQIHVKSRTAKKP